VKKEWVRKIKMYSDSKGLSVIEEEFASEEKKSLL